MNVIKEIVKPINHRIIIELPEEFRNEKEFEVIILPSNEKKPDRSKFFDLAGNIDIDSGAVTKLREDSIL